MYHKVGPRPFGVRLKGLYVAANRFARQIDELAAAGYRSVSIGDSVTSAPESKRFVISFDDGFRDVLENTLAPMAKHQFHGIQYLAVNYLGKSNEWDLRDGEVMEPIMDETQVREWLAAGHEIGSHTLNHPFLSQLPLHDAREEIFASKKRLEDTFGIPIHHFCYPYGDFNKAVRDLVQEAGYTTACLTEFGINTPSTDPYALHRITVRYPSRKLKEILARLFSKE